MWFLRQVLGELAFLLSLSNPPWTQWLQQHISKKATGSTGSEKRDDALCSEKCHRGKIWSSWPVSIRSTAGLMLYMWQKYSKQISCHSQNGTALTMWKEWKISFLVVTRPNVMTTWHFAHFLTCTCLLQYCWKLQMNNLLKLTARLFFEEV